MPSAVALSDTNLAVLPLAVDRPVDFVEEVEPLLAQRCIECHGPTRQRAGLRLDDLGAMLKGGDSVDIVGSPDPVLTAQQRADELDDMVNTTGTAFLGLTLGCARCHTHKFDPIEHREYFAMTAVFAGVRHGDRPLPLQAEDQTRLAKLDGKRTELEQRLERLLNGRLPYPDPVAAPTGPQYRFDTFPPAEAERGRQWLSEYEAINQERERLRLPRRSGHRQRA